MYGYTDDEVRKVLSEMRLTGYPVSAAGAERLIASGEHHDLHIDHEFLRDVLIAHSFEAWKEMSNEQNTKGSRYVQNATEPPPHSMGDNYAMAQHDP